MCIYNTLNLKEIFWKMKTFFKSWSTDFLVEYTKIEIVTISYKTAMSGDHIKANTMGSTNVLKRTEIYLQLLYFIENFVSGSSKLLT